MKQDGRTLLLAVVAGLVAGAMSNILRLNESIVAEGLSRTVQDTCKQIQVWSLKDFKYFAGGVKDAATFAAIIVGGWWTC